jgi:hypothetical protein
LRRHGFIDRTARYPERGRDALRAEISIADLGFDKFADSDGEARHMHRAGRLRCSRSRDEGGQLVCREIRDRAHGFKVFRQS